jgi:hypothetical protein
MGGLQESFALSVPAEKAGPIVAKFHATCSKCPAFVALGEWELTGREASPNHVFRQKRPPTVTLNPRRKRLLHQKLIFYAP